MADEARVSLRDRALLALLLAVGVIAIVSGVVQLIRNPTPPASGIFDAVLGFAVLLVTWLFLAPYVLPHAFVEPAPGEPSIERSYLPTPIQAATAPAMGGRFSPTPVRSVAAVSARSAAPAPWEEETSVEDRAATVPAPAPSLSPRPAVVPGPGARPRPAPQPTSRPARQVDTPEEILEELDSIVKEFRAATVTSRRNRGLEDSGASSDSGASTH